MISAHLAADQTYVIDLTTNRVVATIADTPGAEGVEYVPELKKFYTSNAHDNTIGVVDLKQMKVIKKLKTESKPDGSTYAAPFRKLYVSDERGKAEAIVDVNKDEIVKTLHFDSETGMPQYDSVARKVYVNLQDQNIFAVIDPATDEVVGRYPVGKCKGNHGMALDSEHYRAFRLHDAYVALTRFDIEDLSRFYLDALKDRLYSSAPDAPRRRSAQSALFEIFRTLCVLLAPVLSFTAEEAWQCLDPALRGVHAASNGAPTVVVVPAEGEKCQRCWKYLPLGVDPDHPTLDSTCAAIVRELEAKT